MIEYPFNPFFHVLISGTKNKIIPKPDDGQIGPSWPTWIQKINLIKRKGRRCQKGIIIEWNWGKTKKKEIRAKVFFLKETKCNSESNKFQKLGIIPRLSSIYRKNWILSGLEGLKRSEKWITESKNKRLLSTKYFFDLVTIKQRVKRGSQTATV